MQPFTITHSDDDTRLDRWVKRHFPHISQPFLQKQLRKGAVKVDGKKSEASARLAAGQVVTIAPFLLVVPDDPYAGTPFERPKPKPKPVKELSEKDAEETRAWVLYKDAARIVINKPAGLPVQGGTNLKDHLDGRLEALRFDGERPRLIHRLDRDTSGVMVLGRTSKDAAALGKAFKDKEVCKVYWALVAGVPELREGTIDQPIEKLGAGREKMEASDGGKYAVTHYRVIEALHKSLCWVEMIPVTGRTHQLRVHMASLGHPIIGDGKYGGKAAFLEDMEVANQVHLHARRLILPSMGKLKALDILVPLPPHMQKSWKVLGLSKEDMGFRWLTANLSPLPSGGGGRGGGAKRRGYGVYRRNRVGVGCWGKLPLWLSNRTRIDR